MPQKITWEQVGQTSNPLLSPAYKSNGHVFTSGNVGALPDGSYPEDAGKQAVLAIENLKKLLEASGPSLDKVLKVLLFISDKADAAAINKVYASYFTTAPARSCVIVAFPDERIKVELEAVAEYE